MITYFELFIPLISGLIMIFNVDTLLKIDTAEYENKKRKIKKYGYVLLGVTFVLAVVKYYSS